ncbi:MULTISPECIES: SDR family NAD(P)-dependent oxidoreductase [unclassified Streptomyces]|uniref:SDR family NAD(P)-dependent oxidoreductase n=1 Tax=unclassified Streptomyces TaxID=2593676 RepID=UPI00081DE3BC|nr:MULTISPECIES: SDR family NAD(P)-dependent oxidoreductase [unclassified Streptomyces]MYZ35798.1 SDR family NAD(P)-dependent oxidoreductase [Streptomyces sp. SID4917]SCF78457.1 NAD(P)-dependent dehydrogenase, short-chain alcohol dehydrogenase family [Streptomyces sp. MnatMP-M17]
MDLQLNGKRALVTGSSTGLGEEIAKVLAAEGAAVVVHGRDEARAVAVAKAIREDGGEASVAVGDLATDAGADAVRAASVVGGPVDILVNNLGVYDPAATWSSISSADWSGIYNTNVVSSVRTIQRFVPDMRERGWGRVIQISSVLGDRPMASQPHYAATNAARDNLAASLARELKHTGVTSNSVAAGGILTPTTEAYLTDLGRQNGWGETWEEIEPKAVEALATNDTGRIGRRRDYADLVAFLASPLSGYITGTTLRADGGWYDA